MTDRELLELAAKAAGYDAAIEMYGFNELGEPLLDRNDPPTVWNPLNDDGYALRLAVQLKMSMLLDSRGFSGPMAWVRVGQTEKTQYYNGDPYAATRRAIVRAAAQIEMGME